jgi:uncharacterized protein YbaP (TraB family)
LLQYIIVLVLFLSIPFAANAQNWVTPNTCKVLDVSISDQKYPEFWLKEQEEKFENGVGKLWQIVAPNGNVSYLWGTMHLKDLSVLRLPQTLSKVIDQTQVVLPEVDYEFQSRAEVWAYYSGHGFWASDESDRPHHYIDEKVRAWVEARVHAMGYAQGSMQFMTLPGLTNLMLSDPCNDFKANALIQDDWIVQLAKIHGAQVVGLEQRQALMDDLAQLDNRSAAIAILNLYGSYLNPEFFDEAGQSGLIGMYQKGLIAAMMGDDLETAKGQFGAEKGAEMLRRTDSYMLDFRNVRFLKTADPYLQNGYALMVVGSFHLPGKNGLVRMMRDVGYTVERVPVEGEIGFE